jgi:hypothetical protein
MLQAIIPGSELLPLLDCNCEPFIQSTAFVLQHHQFCLYNPARPRLTLDEPQAVSYSPPPGCNPQQPSCSEDAQKLPCAPAMGIGAEAGIERGRAGGCAACRAAEEAL